MSARAGPGRGNIISKTLVSSGTAGRAPRWAPRWAPRRARHGGSLASKRGHNEGDDSAIHQFCNAAIKGQGPPALPLSGSGRCRAPLVCLTDPNAPRVAERCGAPCPRGNVCSVSRFAGASRARSACPCCCTAIQFARGRKPSSGLLLQGGEAKWNYENVVKMCRLLRTLFTLGVSSPRGFFEQKGVGAKVPLPGASAGRAPLGRWRTLVMRKQPVSATVVVVEYNDE